MAQLKKFLYLCITFPSENPIMGKKNNSYQKQSLPDQADIEAYLLKIT